MELRNLKSFIALAEEGSITNAAKVMNVSQSTLSRQLLALEEELGKQLFTRDIKHASLTEEGRALYRYALSIEELVQDAKAEITHGAISVKGRVRVGCAETVDAVCIFGAIRALRVEQPGIKFHLTYGNSIDLFHKVRDGNLDFVLECEFQPRSDYDYLLFPKSDHWGIMVLASSPLAQKEAITPRDLEGEPIVVGRYPLKSGVLRKWAGDSLDLYDFVLTYNNPSPSTARLLEYGLGHMFVYDFANDDSFRAMSGDPGSFVFKYLDPPLETRHALIWKKRRTLPKPADLFLQRVRQVVLSETLEV